ncbi:gluconate 2-dehydrogenase subunit 3 family protein [Brevibacillus fulvus]|uniref:Gluconate 2-dehydrogenase gamma chain n=1 Tax=Brevibacillus fulvus TaxID=1125967 RepID=A0A938Y3R6_9BACL|nr:gluconate 2-dehydrogenase subunit 3 family protein [Brevibacillus fulvus]MBM7590665.1 gluconate 2-dehydrogenase gamma chain [Brevibacillus fulvus]
MADGKQPQDTSRRSFLKNSGIAIGGLIVGGVVGGALGGGQKTTQKEEVEKVVEKTVDYNQALMYFNQEQFQITEAAAERIYPKDDLGPGAKDLGVAYYIDHQLASPWGMNAKEYMQGPFFPDAPANLGMQSPLRRHEIFSIGLKGLADYCQQKYSKKFQELSEEEQDAVLKVFEEGKEFKLVGTTTSAFFKLLRSATIEGVYSDPMYGGNKDMQGWKMRNYPGNQMGYAKDIEKEGLVKYEPKSLHDHMSMGK